MPYAKPPRPRGRDGRAANARFVEVEMHGAPRAHLVIELEGGARILLGEPAHVELLVQLLAGIAADREGGRQ